MLGRCRIDVACLFHLRTIPPSCHASNRPVNWHSIVFISGPSSSDALPPGCSREEHPSQHVLLLRDGRSQLPEDIGHRVPQLQQTPDEPYLPQGHQSWFLQLHAPSITNFVKYQLVPELSTVRGSLERGLVITWKGSSDADVCFYLCFLIRVTLALLITG